MKRILRQRFDPYKPAAFDIVARKAGRRLPASRKDLPHTGTSSAAPQVLLISKQPHLRNDVLNVPAQAQVREEGYMSWVCRRVRLAIRFMPRKHPHLRKQRIGPEVQDQEEIQVSSCKRDTLWMGKISFTRECPPSWKDHLRG